MALNTYAEMTAAIQAYTQNSESSFVANIPNFIISAEDKIFGAIDMPSSWEDDDGIRLVVGNAEYELGGVSTIAYGDGGVINVLSVRLSENASADDQLDGVEFGPVRYLLQKDYDFLLEAYPGSSSASTKGIPSYYAISKSGVYAADPTLTIRVGPIPNETYQMTVTYSRKTSSDSLVATTAGTWLSSSFPDVLLYGSLVQACIYMKGPADMLQLYEKQFMEGISLLNNITQNRLNQDDYRPSPVAIPQVSQG